MGTVVVIGSINADLLVRVPVLPAPGETVLATEATEARGGKGQAQAIAATRFGARTRFIASTGDDVDGRAAISGLRAEGVDISLVRQSAALTGRAIVTTDATGENSIIVVPGANASLTSLLPADRATIAFADVVLLQLENGLEIVADTVALAAELGITVILNAAPAAAVPTELLDQLDFLIVNELECLQLGGGEDVDIAAHRLTQHAKSVIVTLGARGGRLYSLGSETLSLPALAVEPVDTTGAGDAFCGVFAAAIAQPLPVPEAFRLALVAGSLATLARGNAPAIPLRAAIDAATSG